MAVDGDGGKPPVGSGAKMDDLADYHLDEYDDDVNEEGTRRSLVVVAFLRFPVFQGSVHSRISRG